VSSPQRQPTEANGNVSQRTSALRVASTASSGLVLKVYSFTIVALALCLILLPWQQTAIGYGRVIAYSPNDRQQEISAPVDGRIQHWHVVEGTRVKKGDPIVDLSDNDPEIIQRLRDEREALNRRAKAAASAIQSAKSNLDRQKSLLESGLSAPRTIEQANMEYTRYLVEEANASAELARIDVRLARQLTQSVQAPVDGTILRVVSGQGAQIVKQGQILAVLVPDTGSRVVEVWLNGNDIPLVSEGDHVRLQFEGWPAIQFSGWPSVAVGTFGGVVSLLDAVDNGEGQFRILVSPDPAQPWPETRFLRQGVRAQGWVLLNQVTLGFELWRRFNGFPPSISKGKEPKK